MRTRRKPIQARDLTGSKFFGMLTDLLSRLRDHATERDKAHHRQLFSDQYALLILLDDFNPVVTSLRGIHQFSTLEKVQKTLGVRSTSLGSLSEAAQVFDPVLLEPILAELAEQMLASGQALPPPNRKALADLVAVDGRLLPALPKMAWALWQDATHRAAKVHVAFAVWPNLPVAATVTHGNASERVELAKLARPGGFSVADRGYARYDLFRQLDEQGSRFVIRLQENAVYEVERENPISSVDRAAGVVSDVTVRRLGTEKHNALLEKPFRIVVVAGPTPGQRWVLATNAHTLTGELVAIAYRGRWQIELFFR